MAFAVFNYHGKHIELTAPSWTPIWSGAKLYTHPFDGDFLYVIEKSGIYKCKAIVDAGANIGVHSIYFSNMNPDAQICSYEPASVNYHCLAANVRSYENIRPIKKALGNRNETIRISLPSREQKEFHQARNPLDNPGIISAYGETDLYEEYVRCVRLDDEVEYADFLKIDVEGYELEVLLGAERIIRECRPIIMLESLMVNMKMAKRSEEEYKKFFTKHRYVMACRLYGDVFLIPEG